MKDKNLELKMLNTLKTLERQNDSNRDTLLRQEITESISKIRRLIERPETTGLD